MSRSSSLSRSEVDESCFHEGSGNMRIFKAVKFDTRFKLIAALTGEIDARGISQAQAILVL